LYVNADLYGLSDTAEISPGNDRDRLHELDAKLVTKLLLLRGLTLCAAISHILIERMRREAGYDVLESFLRRGEIDAQEGDAVLIEEAPRPLQRVEYSILCNSHDLSFGIVEVPRQ
jgi:hypothetical protein